MQMIQKLREENQLLERKYSNLLTQFRNAIISEVSYQRLYEEELERRQLWQHLAFSDKSLEDRKRLALTIPYGNTIPSLTLDEG
jgi:hypothetical protein